jgi:hypothetical protein
LSKPEQFRKLKDMLPAKPILAPECGGTRHGLLGAFLVAGCVLCAVLAGCSSSTDPVDDGDPGGTKISFEPAGQGQSLRLSETLDFSVTVAPAQSLNVSWYRQGQVVGQEASYTFVPAAVGKDTLGVSAMAGAVRDTYYWVLTVEEDLSAIPPEVPDVLAGPGPRPADVQVSWKWVTGATFPLVQYQVAVSYDGAINEANWEQAEIIGRYEPVPGQVGYLKIFTEAEHGMRPGQEAWFAVRALDDREQLSYLTKSTHTDITWPWYIEGFVTDDAGLPLLGVILSVDGVSLGNTDGSGYFKLSRAFRSIDSVRVKADPASGVFGFTTDPVAAAGETTRHDIVLLNDYGLDLACSYPDYLAYLRQMGWTETVPGQPDKSRLYTWDQYPVTVYIPDERNEAGVDMLPPCEEALDFWNSQMHFDAQLLGIDETDYFVRVQDRADADIVFLFEKRAQNYGEVSLLLPGPDEELGDVVPELMQIWVNTIAVLDSTAIAGVALHEFGHTLGMFGHSECALESDHLMLPAGGVPAFGRLEPIHLDERRAARAIRNIPQGSNMADYRAGRFQ